MASETTTYRPLYSVERLGADGIELKLALQIRWSARWQEEFPVLSWRTRLRPGGPNRRFYMFDGRPWETTTSTLVDMLEAINGYGALGDAYLDPRPRELLPEVLSSQLGKDVRQRIFTEHTLPTEHWGVDPWWLAVEERRLPGAIHGGPWRKVLIVHRQSGRATIRSTTTDADYRPRKLLRPNCLWYLDNSMPDMTVQQARLILKHLRQLVVPDRPGVG